MTDRQACRIGFSRRPKPRIAGRRKCRPCVRRNHKCRVASGSVCGAGSCIFWNYMAKPEVFEGGNDSIPDTPGQIRGRADTAATQRTVQGQLASKRIRSERMARRPNAAVGVVCPRCGMLAARIIGRSESLPVIYLTCEDCGRTSVAPSGEQA